MKGEQLEFQHSLIEAIHEASPDGILVVDESGVVVSYNQRFLQIFLLETEDLPVADRGAYRGKSDETLLAKSLALIKDPDSFLARVQALYADPSIQDVCEIELNDGRTLERHSTALWAADQRYLGRVWFFRDISERKRYEQLLEAQSNLDPLTGIANRRSFFQRANEAFARARRSGRALSLIMIDIDRFKRINDRWGHAAGDDILKQLCVSATTIMREIDLLGRLGGEEFAILAPDTDCDGALKLAERFRQMIAQQSIAHGDELIAFTISAGVASLVSSDRTAEDVLLRADKALYEAKHAGRDCVMQA